uniref:Uncharacterized protein n=1 Tax=Peromyscus maniculatus bairdii TaxID=230844 RepID=A0A8C8W7B3_PERMB
MFKNETFELSQWPLLITQYSGGRNGRNAILSQYEAYSKTLCPKEIHTLKKKKEMKSICVNILPQNEFSYSLMYLLNNHTEKEYAKGKLFTIQAVIHMVISLLGFMVSPEKLAQDPHPSHPGHFLRHLNVGSTLLLPYAYMPALLLSKSVFLISSPGMDSHRLPDDQPILDQLSHLLTGVGIGDFIGLSGVQPDLLFYHSRGH